MTATILISLIILCILWGVYSTLTLSNALTKANDEINELKQHFKEHEKLPHFQSAQLFRQFYRNALEGKIKSINEINLDFSPYQMRQLAKAIEKNYPNDHFPEHQTSS